VFRSNNDKLLRCITDIDEDSYNGKLFKIYCCFPILGRGHPYWATGSEIRMAGDFHYRQDIARQLKFELINNYKEII
jgi:hypothetical protein